MHPRACYRPVVWQGGLVALLVVQWATAAEVASLLEARQQLDASFFGRQQTLIASSEPPRSGSTVASFERDPSRQYLHYPRELLVFRPTASSAAARPRALVELDREHAARLFALAGEAAQEGQAALAYQWVHEVLRFDPEHSAARRITGLTRSGSAGASGRWSLRSGRRAHARLGWAAGQYLQVNTPHFTIATNDEPSVVGGLAEVLESLWGVWQQVFFDYWGSPANVRRAFQERLPVAPPHGRHQVVLFRNRQQYLDYVRQFEPQAELTLGYYHAATRTAYFVGGPDADPSHWRHEATHQLFQETGAAKGEIGRHANVWIVEGVAMYLESLQSLGEEFTVGGLDASRLQFARHRALQEQAYVPLSQLVALGREDLQRDPRIRGLYSQAAGLTHFLMDGQRGQYRSGLVRYVRQVYAGDDEDATLAHCLNRPLLELDREYLTFLQLTDGDLRRLEPRSQPRHLSLGGTDVTAVGLRHLPNLSRLEWLDLAGLAVADDGLERLSEATQLRQLSLDRTRVTDQTVRLLAFASQLQELDLSETAITDQALITVGQLANLTSLWLTGTGITDEGLRQLRRLDKLQHLDVSRSGVTELGVSALRAALPQLEIQWP